MAYRKQKQLIKPGSLNLAVPTDLAGDDSIALHNFRVDRAGALHSRLSTYTVETGIVGNVHTIFRYGNIRYYGAGGSLYRDPSASIGDAVVQSGATGFDGTALGLAAFQGYLWVMNKSKQGRSSSTGFGTWLPVAPSGLGTPSAAAGGALVDGIEYSYVVTYLTAEDHETNPSNEVTFTPGSGNLTAVITRPTTSDARVTKWRVYRFGNTLDDWYMVAEIAYGTSSFNDEGEHGYGDEEITRDPGIILERDHDAPPAAAGLTGPYYQRLVAWNTTAHPNRLYYTPPNKPYYFAARAWVDVGDDADEIVMCVQHPGHLRIYKKRSVWRLRGDFGTGIMERLSPDLGLIGIRAIDSAGGIDYLQGKEGIYASNGDSLRKISPKLDPLFRDGTSYSTGVYPTWTLHQDETERAKSSIAVKNGRLYFCYLDNDSNWQTLVCELDALSWATSTVSDVQGGYTVLYYEGQYSELLGATNGIIQALEFQATSESMALKWTSAYQDQGVRDRKKTYADLVVEHSTKRSASADRNLTLTAKLDSGDTADVTLGNLPVATTATGPARTITTLPIGTNNLGKEARNLALAVSGNCEHEVVIYSTELHFFVEPREARTFDSSILDLGHTGYKEVDLFWLDILASDVVTWRVSSDLPGSAMAQRQTGTFAATSTRVPVPIPLDCDGRLFRFTVTSPGLFRLYGAKVRFLPIGLYLDGVRSETYMTPDLAIGIAA